MSEEIPFVPPEGKGSDLVMLLHERYGLAEEQGYRTKKSFITPDKLSDLEWQIRQGDTVGDGVTVTVARQGADYSEIDPDCHPLSVVYKFTYPDGKLRYLQVYGHYVSHDGGYWDGWKEVVPQVKTVTVYE